MGESDSKTYRPKENDRPILSQCHKGDLPRFEHFTFSNRSRRALHGVLKQERNPIKLIAIKYLLTCQLLSLSDGQLGTLGGGVWHPPNTFISRFKTAWANQRISLLQDV